MIEPIQKKYDKSGAKVVEQLKKRHFEACYCSTKEEAIEKILAAIPKEHSVSWGGTITMDQLNLKQHLSDAGYKCIDRDTAKDVNEKIELMHKALLCGTYIMSSNAITEDGQLLNIDGNGNRVAALCYGPESVIIIAGMNKVVKDIDAAYSRARNYAAPANNQRFPNSTTPCSITGECADCLCPDSICNQFVITRMCRPEKRIKVFLIGEDLGL